MPLVDGTVALIDQPQDVALMRRMLRDPTEGDTIRNEAANLLGRSQVKELVADLQAVLVHPAEAARFRSFAAQHLGLCWERAGYQPDLPEHRALQQALTDRHVEVRREALLALSRGKDPQVPTRIRELLADPTASDQHDLCCRLVADLGLTEHQATLQTLIGSSHESVAVAALDAVGRLKAASLRPAVETATTDPRPRVATTARRVLVLLGK
jgi:HEAT repeat protein